MCTTHSCPVAQAQGSEQAPGTEGDPKALKALAQAALAQAKKELEWARSCPTARRDEEVRAAGAKVREASACIADLRPMAARQRSARDRADALEAKAKDLQAKYEATEQEAARFRAEAAEAAGGSSGG